MGRRVYLDLGAVAVGESSPEADIRSFTHAFVLITAEDAANVRFRLEANPTGNSDDWYEVLLPERATTQVSNSQTSEANTTNSVAGSSFVYSLPLPSQGTPSSELFDYNTFDYMIPGRIRIKNTGLTEESDFSSVLIEAHQRRG